MAMTPTPMSPSPISDRVSAIENEIPEYRAISPLAITSLFFGLASALSFADYVVLDCRRLGRHLRVARDPQYPASSDPPDRQIHCCRPVSVSRWRFAFRRRPSRCSTA